MIEQWVLEKIEPLKQNRLIILRDPQRILQPGAHAVHGWAEENDFTAMFCVGNLALREMYEAIRDEPDTRVLFVDRSREAGRLFYPDLQARAGKGNQIELHLRDFLVSVTGDTHWPRLVGERNISRLILKNVPGTLEAHEQLRKLGPNRFSDSDLYKIVIGATLGINPFKNWSASEIRRLCIEQHAAIDELTRVLPADAMADLHEAIKNAPKPFCWLMERDPDMVIRAFTLAALMHQHQLDYKVLLSNLDPLLHDYRDIAPSILEKAMKDQLQTHAESVIADVDDAEHFLQEDEERLAFLLHDRLQVDDPEHAVAVLAKEKFSPLIRSMALVSLLADLIMNKHLKFHATVIALLDQQAQATDVIALSRPSQQWQDLEQAYRRAFEVFQLTDRLASYAKHFQVTPAEKLNFDTFDTLWNEDRLNRLDYYASELERVLRIGDILPIPQSRCWKELSESWDKARSEFSDIVRAIQQTQNLIDTRFQDFYKLRYAELITQTDAPVVFTHQFLRRMLQAHWDPKSGKKAVVMVFDGMRTDAWDEFLRPVFEERFEIIERRPGSAIIPTETHLSRKAISAGTLPTSFVHQRELTLLESWLKQHMGLVPQFQVITDDDTIASGMTVRYKSDILEYIVFNFTDSNLHNNPQDLSFIYNTTVREIIRQDVRSVLREQPDNALIFIVSDHGFAVVPEPTITVPESVVHDRFDVKFRNARTVKRLEEPDEKRVIWFDVRKLGIPTTSGAVAGQPINFVLFPRPGYTFKRPKYGHKPDRYAHGGISLAECMVPMVVMGPPRRKTLLLQLQDVRQAGSIAEGDLLTLEIIVAPQQQDSPGTAAGKKSETVAITLAFSRTDIPTRREVFRGQAQTYTVRWNPKLDHISDADRQRGTVVLPVTVILSYRQGNEAVRLSRSVDVRIKLDPSRLHRRIDSKLDLLMGKTPKGLQS